MSEKKLGKKFGSFFRFQKISDISSINLLNTKKEFIRVY